MSRTRARARTNWLCCAALSAIAAGCAERKDAVAPRFTRTDAEPARVERPQGDKLTAPAANEAEPPTVDLSLVKVRTSNAAPTTPRAIAVSERCSWAGKLRQSDVRLLSRSGKVVGQATDVVLGDLAPPPNAGEPYIARVEFPIRAQVTIASDEEPLAVTRDVAIIPNHVWIAAHTSVQISSTSGTTARITKKFSATGSRTMPASFTGEVRCDELALSTNGLETLPKVGEPAFTTAGPLVLFAAPAAKRVAVVEHFSAFTIVEKRGVWTRVAGTHPFMFDAWMSGAKTPVPGVIVERAGTVPAAIILTRDLEFRLGPTLEYPVDGHIAAGAELLVGRTDGSLTPVQVAGLVAPFGHPRVLFVRRSELRGAWKSHLGPSR